MTTYKPHYACFDCRKTFKRRLITDIEGGFNKNKEEIKAKCPECGGIMADMGLDFESPKRNDLKAWEHIRNLYISGITFHSCGCTGPGYIPKDYESLVSYLERIKGQYIDHRHFWQRRVEPINDSEKQKDWDANKDYLFSIPQDLKTGTKKKRRIDIDKAIDYWTKNINDIDSKIKELTKANN
jgi:DNA-directed RNA polymerase subunit RPC12/RpoP